MKKHEIMVGMAIEALEKNKECYIAQWIIQNLDKDILNYMLCHQTVGNEFRIWLKEKEG